MDFTNQLLRHLPVLRYDSQEPYFADSAATWTDNPGNELRRADGALLAAADAHGDRPRLSLGFLAPARYADGTAVADDDRIKNPSHGYMRQARRLHAQSQYANRIYGHWATGGDGRVWLAYWFFYFYNDCNLLGSLAPAGLHEGDWEMIQLRLDGAARGPDLALYAQHRAGSARPWADVERIGDRPVVYPARGSHASYFEAGAHWSGGWFDHADGQRPAGEPTLEVIRGGDPCYGWASWPGRWGGTEPHAGFDGLLEDSSPRGPATRSHWRDPAALLMKCTDHEAPEPPAPASSLLPMAPIITVTREDGVLHIDYSSSDSDLAMLLVSVNSAQQQLPPALHRLPIASPRGALLVQGALHDEGRYEINVSTAARDGRASASTKGLLAPA